MAKNGRYYPSTPKKNQEKEQQKLKATAKDSYTNVAARIGIGSDNVAEMGGYVTNYMTRNYRLIQSLYRNNWIITKVIDMISEDMIKNWIEISTTAADSDNIVKFDRYVNTIRLKEQILQGIKWSRLYGGALGIIVIKGQEDQLDQPLNLDTIMPDSFRGLIILDRWQGVSPSLELVDDFDDPNYDTPMYYNINAANMDATRVHHSRCIRFINGELPYWERISEMYWGISEVEKIYDIVSRYDATSANIHALLFSANLKVINTDGLLQRLGTGNREDEDRFYSQIQAMNQMMTSHSIQLLDKDDTMTTFPYTFGGIDQVYQSFMLDLSGAVGIPATKLFGRSPQGMNATGESDLQLYYESINQKQNIHLKPVIDRLIPLLCLSVWGMVPEDIEFKFTSIRQPTIEELKNQARDNAKSVVEVYSSGLVNQKMALKALQTGAEWMDVITDEDIENAEASLESPDILSSLMGGMSGGANTSVGSEETTGETIPESNN